MDNLSVASHIIALYFRCLFVAYLRCQYFVIPFESYLSLCISDHVIYSFFSVVSVYEFGKFADFVSYACY